MVTSNAMVHPRPAEKSFDFGNKGKFGFNLTFSHQDNQLFTWNICSWYRPNMPVGLAA